MTPGERSEMLTTLYKLQAELAAAWQKCTVYRAVSLGVCVSDAQKAINEAIEEFNPDPPERHPNVMR